jgi:two-component system OmpR family sensor kinase
MKKPKSLLSRTLLAVTAASAVLIAVTAAVQFDSSRRGFLTGRDAHLQDMAAALARADVAYAVPGALTMEPEQFEKRLESDEPLTVRGRGMMGGGNGMAGAGGVPAGGVPEDSCGGGAGRGGAPEDGCGGGAGGGNGMMGRGMGRGMMGMGRGMMGMGRGMQMSIDPVRRTEIPAGEPVSVRLIAKQGQIVQVTFPEALRDGISTQVIGGEPQRLCVVFLPTGRYTAVAEPIAARDADAMSSALRSVAPLLVLLPVLLIVIALVIWRSMRPLAASAKEIVSRRENDLRPLSTEGVPAEVLPYVSAVNTLLSRAREARTRDIRLTADAAHELRSPLTALTVEADHLASLPLPAEARDVVAGLRSGLERAVRQVSQLLLFSRARNGEDPALLTKDAKPWSLSDMAAGVLEPFLSSIEEKRLSFAAEGLDAADEEPVEGISRAPLEAIVRNLIENAVRYTPEGGSVTLDVKRDKKALTLSVADSGPGIPPKERERVFDPFYRIVGSGQPGTGLGLAIVRTYADMIGAKVTLDDAVPGRTPPGLKVTVSVPLP